MSAKDMLEKHEAEDDDKERARVKRSPADQGEKGPTIFLQFYMLWSSGHIPSWKRISFSEFKTYCLFVLVSVPAQFLAV